MGQLQVFPDDVIVTSELTQRPSRRPDYRAELRAIKMLVSTMSETAHEFWRRLAETALQLCRAGTAGVSLLATESGEEVFRAEAVAGVLSASIPSIIPRDATPCGVAMDRSGTQLVRLPERFFSSLRFERPIAEALITPFDVQGKPAGTVWVVAHDDSCKFDREDERIGTTLASFAALACHIRSAPATAQPPWEGVEAGHIRAELQHLSDGLETRALEKTAELMAGGGHGDMPESVSTETLSSLRNVDTEQVQNDDFNNLITVIAGYATLMREDLDDSTKLQEDIEAISEAASLVQALINSHSMKQSAKASS
jgi:hypothetical protein